MTQNVDKDMESLYRAPILWRTDPLLSGDLVNSDKGYRSNEFARNTRVTVGHEVFSMWFVQRYNQGSWTNEFS
jgi:hypothetical protein